MLKDLMPVITAGIGLLGVFVGANISQDTAWRVKKLEALQALRSETYIDFFTAQAKLQHANTLSGDENTEEKKKLLDEYGLQAKEARFRLAAFAPAAVVKSLAGYYRIAYGFD